MLSKVKMSHGGNSSGGGGGGLGGGVGLNGKMKSQDLESNTKILRELTHLPANKYCFDCNQRGPTYVNVTIGSFICSTCSGLLRGLTPPHRVKSISMASFTADEIEILKTKGNEYCRRVWLATFNGKEGHLGADNNPDRVNILKNFLVNKYEHKRYYIDPSRLSRAELTEIQEQTARALSQASSGGSAQKSPSLSSLSSAASNPSPLLHHQQRKSPINRLPNSITLPDIKPLSSLFSEGAPSFDLNSLSIKENSTENHKSAFPMSNNNNNNTLFEVNGSPWGGDNGGTTHTNGDSFEANFEDAFKQDGFPGFTATFPPTGTTPAQQPQQGFGAFQTNNPPMQPNQGLLQTTTTQNQGQNSAIDRYAALKDLDDLFKTDDSDEKKVKESNGLTDGSHLGSSGGGGGQTTTLSNSFSLPANLASSGNWFSASDNQQNPFSQATSPPNSQLQPNKGGWGGQQQQPQAGGLGSNPNNPFFANTWQPSQPSPMMQNGGGFSTGFPSHQTHHVNLPMSLAPQPNLFAHQQQPEKTFNPFFQASGSTATLKSNPNNPFL